jgi:hypothetical protein
MMPYMASQTVLDYLQTHPTQPRKPFVSGFSTQGPFIDYIPYRSRTSSTLSSIFLTYLSYTVISKRYTVVLQSYRACLTSRHYQANVIVDDNERAVLIDFNKSVVIQKADPIYLSSDVEPSRWQAPELRICGQGTRLVPNLQSEIWSLGCVMLEVSTIPLSS